MASYLRPAELSQALDALGAAPLTIVAGGTDFYPARVGRALDDDVLDITDIAALRGIGLDGEHFRIGALARWSELIAADLPPCFDGLKLAAREVGGVQIQNAGTVCGNLCNASPAADGVPPLLTLDAEVEIASSGGLRRAPLDRFITGNRKTVLSPGEMVTAVLVPARQAAARSTFVKLGARKYMVISIVMVAALVEMADDGAVAAARIAVGACSEVARRLDGLEAELIGRPLDGTLGAAVTAAHLASLSPIDDLRGPATYRADAALTLVRRALDRLGAAS